MFEKKNKKKMQSSAYLMVEFRQETQLPHRIDVYSESQNEITRCGNGYVCIASMKWNVCSNEDKKHGFHIVHQILKSQFKEGMYDHCSFTHHGKKWTVQECKQYAS